MAALLVGLAVMSIMMTAVLPVWSREAKREKEVELIWRGEQYARAIGLFQRKYANAFPPTLDVLVEQRFLRKKYKDPMTKDGEFQPLYAAQVGATPGQAAAGSAARPGQAAQPAAQPATVSPQQQIGPRGGIMGVASKSTETSIKLYNGRNKYNEWTFVYTQLTTRAGAPTGGVPGAARPGQRPGQPGQGAIPGMPGQRQPGQPGRPGTGPGGNFPGPDGVRRVPSPFNPPPSGQTPDFPGGGMRPRPPQ